MTIQSALLAILASSMQEDLGGSTAALAAARGQEGPRRPSALSTLQSNRSGGRSGRGYSQLRGLKPAQRGGAGGAPSGPTYQIAGAVAEELKAAALAANRATGAGAPGKWGLINTAGLAKLPAPVLGAVSSGPLSEEEAEQLVALLTGGELGAVADEGEIPMEMRLAARKLAPDLSPLQARLDPGMGAPDDPTAGAIDEPRLRDWFERIDRSGDAAITYLEWRDHGGLTLEPFRRLDTTREGLVSFEEFSRGIIANAVALGSTSVDPELVMAVFGGPEESPTIPPAALSLEELSEEEVLRRARAEVAAAAAALEAKAAMDAMRQAGKGGDGGPPAPRPPALLPLPDRTPAPPDATPVPPADGGSGN